MWVATGKRSETRGVRSRKEMVLACEFALYLANSMIKTYNCCFEKTFLIIFVVYKKQLCNSKGVNSLAKPEKIYLNNTNQIFTFEMNKPDIGNLRETFFFNQLRAVCEIKFYNKTDFIIDGKYIFEIGGKNKGHEQIMGLKDAYLALDNLEYGFGNKIPLWLFGILY